MADRTDAPAGRAPGRPTEETGPATVRERRRRLAGRVAVAVVVVGTAAMWLYVLTADPDIPGRLVDPSYGPAAELVCAPVDRAISQLPKAETQPDPLERAATVDDATSRLDAMVDELGAVPVAAGADRTAVDEWLDDWRTYLDDRRDYTARLRQDREARFYVTEREEDGRQLTVAMDRFAEVNAMSSCATPGDVG